MATTSVMTISIIFIFITFFTSQTLADCESESSNKCNNKEKAQTLKLISIFSILVTSMIGVCLPLMTRSIPALRPENNLFIIVKCFAAGIILGTGFMHVLPDSFNMLWSDCLNEKPWREFPFSGLVAMFSAVVTMMVDSLATSFYGKKFRNGVIPESHVGDGGDDREMGVVSVGHSHGHHHFHHEVKAENAESQQLLRYRVVAMVNFNSCKI